MDDKRFDTWTRRRFGLEAGVGGALAGLFALACGADAEGKKNRKKRRRRRRKRCLRKNDTCTQGGKRNCCQELRCDFPAAVSMRTHCCGVADERCDEDFDCCVRFRCNLERGRCEAP